MTQIQVDYQKAEETKRHNKEMEALGLKEVEARNKANEIAEYNAKTGRKNWKTSTLLGVSDQLEGMSNNATHRISEFGNAFKTIGSHFANFFTSLIN